MRAPVRRRSHVRSALDAAAIPTWSGQSVSVESSEAPRFLQAPGLLPRGRRVYAIGDIHGHLGKLTALHRAIARDLATRPTISPLLVHLGDYIDQGPDSAGVLALLAKGSPLPKVAMVNLLGDHERMLVDALNGDRAAATDWLWAGGRDSLASWGLSPDLPREEWETALPPDQVGFLRGLVSSHREGNYLFVHAGIRPGVPLVHQTLDDLTTIRQPFLFTEQDLGAIVVHGHSTAPLPFRTANQIGIDTGAGMGDKLTCAILEDDVVAFLTA